MRNFIKDIDDALQSYSTLKRVEEDGFIRVKGEIPLIHPEKGEFDRYEVSIRFTQNYPKCFPKVIETSNKIPREADRHINQDNTLCLAVEPEENSIVKNGISFKFFLDNVLVPHLASETYREIKDIYPDGEYSHGNDGIWEFYESILNKKDRKSIIIELDQIVKSNWPERNNQCICGSGVKFKKCHLDKWIQVMKSGEIYLRNQILILKNNN
jgi:hypothetical protein